MGASAVFLSIICKVQKIKNYWGEGHLNLTRLSKGDDIPSAEQILEDQSKIIELTSPSRLILTYIRNVSILESRSVSVCELGNVFGKVYSISIISSCLANMLYREDHGLWRRPIIFSNNAVRSSENIADALSLQLMNSLQKHPDRMTYSEITVCDCGDAFINRVSCDFEYYAIRLGYNTSMYLIHDSGEIQQIIDDVYSAVEACCKKMKVFAAVYKHKYMIDNKKMYNELRIHPLTYKGSTQLHTERVIFNHIEYLDIFRTNGANIKEFGGNPDEGEAPIHFVKENINTNTSSKPPKIFIVKKNKGLEELPVDSYGQIDGMYIETADMVLNFYHKYDPASIYLNGLYLTQKLDALSEKYAAMMDALGADPNAEDPDEEEAPF